ncbi:streptomycin 3-adenylyltransferase [Paenibacillus tianmuensis]|uniref:Spectinomycin 9-adenylyltransferase n=1 Tax=Paenibacillus tianmuensis TaxID=624147 RepID=A0A1G4SUD1_9BACL|nr:aminoglycoside adenylyltransferase domain-containing protein [Paenibacillus tianmuensis]SCW72743.1 streptomycin 3-adenylyltransferase [Paenibacillus tianmuensis]
MPVPSVLDNITSLFKEELNDNLTGIYLHGSLAMGCFNPDKSDIDLLIVTKRSLAAETARQIAKKLLVIDDELPNKGGIELSVVLESSLDEFVYPTPFEFHYSPLHRDKYRTDENYICGGREDPDLAAHFVVAYHRGIALYGKPLREVMQPIDKRFYTESILHDVEDAPQGILEAPEYYVLNLCRALYYLKEGVVSSKREGGEWGLKALPSEYVETVRLCLERYGGRADRMEPDKRLLSDFAGYMLGEIRRSVP